MRFVLVHGGFHGAWCWDRTTPELERLGHEAVAIDLPGHGEKADDTRPTTVAGRVAAITEVMQAGDVLVGHSGGGFDISLAANTAPELVGHLVFLAAALPREGRTMPEAMVMDLDGEVVADFDVTGMLQHLHFDDDGTMTFPDVEGPRQLFFHDCDETTVQWAFARLCAERGGETSSQPLSVPRLWEAQPPRSYVRCLQDRAKPLWLSEVVTARLGVEPLTIDASHSPFLSRPAELAELLVHATTTEPVGPLRTD
jgi:pimeloyl-ACP methyl ester carboxylesterase